MQFLRTLFWVMVAAIVVIFSGQNWTPVQVSLWGGLVADVKLPLLLMLAFVAGFVPSYLMQKAKCWQLKRKLDSSNRALDDLRDQLGPSPSLAAAPAEHDPYEP